MLGSCLQAILLDFAKVQMPYWFKMSDTHCIKAYLLYMRKIKDGVQRAYLKGWSVTSLNICDMLADLPKVCSLSSALRVQTFGGPLPLGLPFISALRFTLTCTPTTSPPPPPHPISPSFPSELYDIRTWMTISVVRRATNSATIFSSVRMSASTAASTTVVACARSSQSSI